MATALRRWMYFDREGIQWLHDQLGEGRVIERTTTVADASSQSKKSGLELGVFSSKIRGEREGNASNRHETVEKVVASDAQLLLQLESYLAIHDGLDRLVNVTDVARLAAAGRNSLVMGVLRFRWSALYDTDPLIEATKKQMVEFTFDNEDYENSGMVSVPLRMAGSLEKCVGNRRFPDGSIAPSTHFAMFLRHLVDRALPLGFFAHFQPLGKLLYLKPYAIWFA